MPATKHMTGFFRLTEDVKNPHPDRRSKSGHSLEVWPKGTKVQVRQIEGHRAELIFRDSTRLFFTDGVEDEEKGFLRPDRIMPKLQAEPLNVGILLERHVRGADVLAVLVEKGVITLDQIGKVVDDMQDMSDDDYKALWQKHWL
jgi:hypothetical protein